MLPVSPIFSLQVEIVKSMDAFIYFSIDVSFVHSLVVSIHGVMTSTRTSSSFLFLLSFHTYRY